MCDNACATALPSELLLNVLQPQPVSTLVRCQRVCRAWRAVVEEVSAGAVVALGKIDELRTPFVNQTTLCTALGLTAADARTLPHVVRGTRYVVHIFVPTRAIDALAEAEGWTAVAARLSMKENKKRKRDSLDNRRIVTCTKRRARFDEWLAKSAPFGSDIISVEDWTQACDGLQVAIAQDATLSKYLSGSILTGPSLADAQAAAFKVHQRLAARTERAEALRLALGARGLKRRADSQLCNAFEAGAPIGTFTTAETVADEMAFMHWLYEFTDYPLALDKKTEELALFDGYYPGINADARDLVKARFVSLRPTVWPWLRQ